MAAKMYPMVNLELDDEDSMDTACPLPISDKPKYSYGLRICLTNPELEKLDVDPSEAFVGAIIHIHALAEITCVSSSEMESGEKQNRIEATLTHMCLESEDEENAAVESSMNRKSVLYDR